MKYARYLYLLSTLMIFILLLVYCQPEKDTQQPAADKYLNMSKDVHYVGMDACRQCHTNVHTDFIQTGMGQSLGKATKEKSAATYGSHAIVYDEDLNFYYKPFWRNDSLKIMEFRLEGSDTVHRRIESIDYIIGSGQHTNSHLVQRNGFLYQAPVTYYTQSERWDLAPGFDKGFNSRFHRVIATECITCHNALPGFDNQSMNRYTKVPEGIDCERCHGPGSLHVKEKQRGNLVDTSKFIDYTIVNPADLPRSEQMSVCLRCHLQGVSVLKPGKDFFDFRPGMQLTEVFDVFLPRFEGEQEEFIMASQADRLMMSRCFKESETLTCVTCHNPHISVKVTPQSHFTDKCMDCHAGANDKDECDLDLEKRISLNNNNCIECHMPSSGSIDIPHVAITDHFIRKPKKEDTSAAEPFPSLEEISRFIELECMTDDNPDDLTRAKGFIAFYERFSSRKQYLDSAARLLQEVATEEEIEAAVHLYFIKEEYYKVVKIAEDLSIKRIGDSWTAYRIGEAYYQRQDYKKALPYYERAVALKPLILDFNNKLGGLYLKLQETDKAKARFEHIINADPAYFAAWSNLGYIYFQMGEIDIAARHYEKALQLSPDYVPALLNQAALYLFEQKHAKAKAILKRVLQIDPGNEQAREVLRKMGI